MNLGRNNVKGLLVGYRDVLYLKMHKYLTPELDTFTLKKTCSIKLFYFTFSCNISNINYCLNFVSIEYVISCQIHKSQRDNSTVFYQIPKTSFLSISRTWDAQTPAGGSKRNHTFLPQKFDFLFDPINMGFFSIFQNTLQLFRKQIYMRAIFFWKFWN